MAALRVDGIAASLALVVSGLVGCGSDGFPNMVPIRGEVYFDGKPLTNGFVVYLPKTVGVGRQATGPVKPDGSFVLTTQVRGDGAMHGEYDIVVYENRAPGAENETREGAEAAARQRRSYAFPPKYSSQFTSGLSDTVDENHAGFKRIELVE